MEGYGLCPPSLAFAPNPPLFLDCLSLLLCCLATWLLLIAIGDASTSGFSTRRVYAGPDRGMLCREPGHMNLGGPWAKRDWVLQRQGLGRLGKAGRSLSSFTSTAGESAEAAEGRGKRDQAQV